jgi:hypothetical protein
MLKFIGRFRRAGRVSDSCVSYLLLHLSFSADGPQPNCSPAMRHGRLRSTCTPLQF